MGTAELKGLSGPEFATRDDDFGLLRPSFCLWSQIAQGIDCEEFLRYEKHSRPFYDLHISFGDGTGRGGSKRPGCSHH